MRVGEQERGRMIDTDETFTFDIHREKTRWSANVLYMRSTLMLLVEV